MAKNSTKGRKTITLYFTEESGLSDEQRIELEHLPGGRHRNAAMVDPEAPLEECDYVSGPAVPDSYSGIEFIEPQVPEGTGDAEEEVDDPNEMTVTVLKAALTEANVEFPATAKKAALVALYQEHLGD